METPAQIDFQGMEPKDSLREKVQHNLARLESRFGRITAGRVVIKGPGEHHQRRGLYEVSIRLAMPHTRDVNVARTPEADGRYADLAYAIGDAFKQARRQLQDRVRRLEQDVKHHEARPAGRVARIDPSREFGFISAADGREVYFHRNSVLNDGFGRLKPGTAVAFAEEDGEKGPQASTVRLLGKHIVP